MSLLLTLLIALGSQAFATPKTYLGSVGSGVGTAVLGHGFIVFGDSQVPDYSWITYDYSVVKKDGTEITLHDAVEHPESLLFKVQKLPFFMHKLHYQLEENRTLSLVGLKLADSQREALLKNVDRDFQSATPSVPYSLYGANCITRILVLLNKVLEPSQRLPLYNDHFSDNLHSRTSSVRKYISNSLLDELPFNVLRVARDSSIYSGEFIVWQGRDQILARQIAEVKSLNQRFVQECRWPSELEKPLLYSFLNISRGKGNHFEILFSKLLEQCPSQEQTLSQIAYSLARMVYEEKLIHLREKLLELGQKYEDSL